MERSYEKLLKSYLTIFPCVALIGVRERELRGLREFVEKQKARLGLVINNDVSPRRYAEQIVGLPFTWL